MPEAIFHVRDRAEGGATMHTSHMKGGREGTSLLAAAPTPTGGRGTRTPPARAPQPQTLAVALLPPEASVQQQAHGHPTLIFSCSITSRVSVLFLRAQYAACAPLQAPCGRLNGQQYWAVAARNRRSLLCWEAHRFSMAL